MRAVLSIELRSSEIATAREVPSSFGLPSFTSLRVALPLFFVVANEFNPLLASALLRPDTAPTALAGLKKY